MEILNVIITNTEGTVNDIESFVVHEEQLKDEVVEKAEEFFLETINNYHDGLSEDTLDEFVENGVAEIGHTVISIVWSYA